ncbi:MAG: pyridoxamine 5'-phosphate oxidase, partial [Acidovorax sp.]|nr:pyridoxamine 5'-phosphate oxidase [Acidovorax sp.]
PEAAPMTALGDFQFVQIIPSAGRHVAGFGAARDLSAEELKALLMS